MERLADAEYEVGIPLAHAAHSLAHRLCGWNDWSPNDPWRSMRYFQKFLAWLFKGLRTVSVQPRQSFVCRLIPQMQNRIIVYFQLLEGQVRP